MTTQIGPFELINPVPAMREPRMLVALQPWLDVGTIGTIALAFIGESLAAQPLSQLTRRNRVFDFT